MLAGSATFQLNVNFACSRVKWYTNLMSLNLEYAFVFFSFLFTDFFFLNVNNRIRIQKFVLEIRAFSIAILENKVS